MSGIVPYQEILQRPVEELRLDALSTKAEALSTLIESSQFLFENYAREYVSMAGTRQFRRGNLSGQCEALLENVETLSRDREAVKRGKNELKKELDTWRQDHIELNEFDSCRVREIEAVLRETDGLDKRDAPPKEYDLYVNEEKRCHFVCTPDVCADRQSNPRWCKIRWLLCFPCSLIAAPCFNRYVCGTKKIEWLKRSIKKGIHL